MTTTTTAANQSSIAIGAASAAAAAAATVLLLRWSSRPPAATSPTTAASPQQRRIAELEGLVERWKGLRLAERNGRTRAEARLRELQVAAAASAAAAASGPAAGPASAPGAHAASAAAAAAESSAAPSRSAATGAAPDGHAHQVWPLRPIGRLRSVFAGRNGTPRQPLRLAPSARAVLQLSSWVPAAALGGLEGYTHVWLIYAFHANTDAGKAASNHAASAAKPSFRAKVHVPRLDGGRLGVLATRSPHRPSPIGLSAARLLAVLPGGRLLLGGADVVDGTPVLDVKPYVPFCDSVPGARAPGWVAQEAGEDAGGEPLHVAEVVVGKRADARLREAWGAVAGAGAGRGRGGGRGTGGRSGGGGGGGGRGGGGSLYDTADEFLALVREVLSRDIRSAHQRLRAKQAAAVAARGDEEGEAEERDGRQGNGGGGGGGSDAGEQQGGDNDNDDDDQEEGRWHVVLDGVDISYEVDAAGRVLIRNAVPAAGAAANRAAAAPEGAAAAPEDASSI